ncbi:MAG TPA: putative lipid II flippase FtsW [Gammaproteobacteria bacterium]|nr:putative lipid II flippase FtsW [Gammaproteobacteria bacterium]
MGAIANRQTAYDPWLFLSLVSLIGLGLVMVTSASLSFAEGSGLPAGYFAIRHVIYLAIGLVGFAVTTYLPLSLWRKLSIPLLIITIGLLALLLIPGISRQVNGSSRWLFLGPISIQVSEFAKLFVIIYMAQYLVQRHKEVQTELSGFIKPMLMLGLVSALLLLEPDFGATVVIVSTTMGMLFLAGVPIRRFLVVLLPALGALGILSITSPYRMQRLTSFLNPWTDQFNTGYQLTQSLIAFGRGGWFGTGLGNSVQKLLYLPEAHNDFIFAVLAEELGLVGAMVILLFFGLLVWRILTLGRQAILFGHPFAGFMAYGIGLWFGFQSIINIGVNLGVLPTKGLTLPFMSYGGCSLIVGLLAVGILLRIEFELSNKKQKTG